MTTGNSESHMWLTFALMTVLCWGLYGITLHAGQLHMGDAANGRYKAFLFVGIAYFLTAVVAPLIVLLTVGADWKFTRGGVTWSLIAGILGAAGAFCVLLAFGAKGAPSVVMSIIFAGAPIVNAIVAMMLHPPQGGLRAIPLPFFLGIVLAAVGGMMVTLYKPQPGSSPGSPQPPPTVHEQTTHG